MPLELGLGRFFMCDALKRVIKTSQIFVETIYRARELSRKPSEKFCTNNESKGGKTSREGKTGGMVGKSKKK